VDAFEELHDISEVHNKMVKGGRVHDIGSRSEFFSF